eukprot:TRINITY_DN8026_c0_g3_i1.p1 TRINITY_DN8026_c0_g3~~TRINITY_DN8026_c0_g3_i1.p1  ORF type:complete len:228 (-),score=42.77 TRINITY_DN8026_c0_g3_i1:89-772(-)
MQGDEQVKISSPDQTDDPPPNTVNERYWYPTTTLFYYCYVFTHSLWKIFVINSILYNRQVFAHLFLVRCTLIMAALSLLFRHDVLTSHSLAAKIGYALLILPLVSLVTRVIKFICKNKPVDRARVSKNYFVWRLVVGYALGLCIIVASGIIVVINERISPYSVSLELTELYAVTLLIDIVAYQLLAGVFQFVMVIVAYKKMRNSDLSILVDDELKEELGFIEPGIFG